MKPNDVITLGCRLNAFESEVIRNHLARSQKTNTYVINTCGVTNEAVRQARQTIRKVRRKHPDSEIIVTGCAAQLDPNSFAKMPEVNLVLGNEEKLKAKSYTRDLGNQNVLVGNIMKEQGILSNQVVKFKTRTRAFLQIQQGCMHRCTFCIIPFGRGNSRSVPPNLLVNQAKKLIENGHRELTLTGVDISSYGLDLPDKPSLCSTIRNLLRFNPEIMRLRLSSLDPAVINSDLVSLMADEPRLMPHLHLSLQSGNNTILKRMKRRHLRDDIIRLSQNLRRARPDIVLGADVIVGFPTETDTMFRDTVRVVEEAGVTYLHIFPYSMRHGTPAAKMPQVPDIVRKERSAILRTTGEINKSRYFDELVGSELSVLVEKGNRGYTEGYAPVKFPGPIQVGEIQNFKITGRSDQFLMGELLH